jgi:O-antigen/teichoic acid export membrane protein
MSRSKRFLSGLLLGYTFQALSMVVGLWLTPFLLHRIGQHDYGLWLIAIQILAYMALVDIGVVALLPREVAYVTGRNAGSPNAPELPFIIGRTARLVLFQMPLVTGVAAALWFLFPFPSEYRSFIGLILLVFILMFPLRIFRATVEGLQDLQFMGRLQICSWATGTLLMVALTIGGFGVYALAIGWGVSQLTSNAAFAYRVWSRYPQVLPTHRSHFTAPGAGDYLKRGLWASVSQIAQPLLSGSDILIIGKVIGAAAVVPYSCTGKLVSVLSNQPQMILEMALPGLSEIRAGKSKKDILRVATALTQASLMISGAVVYLVVLTNRDFVKWWVGPRQFSGYAVSLLIAFCMMLRNWNNTTVYTMFSFGMERRLSLMVLLDGLVTVGASALLIGWLGPIGGPMGAIFSALVVSLPANLSAIAGEAGVTLAGLLRPLWPWFWRFVLLVMGGCLYMARGWAASNLWQLACAAVLAGLSYVAVMVSIGPSCVLWPYLRPRVMPLWSALGVKLGWTTIDSRTSV